MIAALFPGQGSSGLLAGIALAASMERGRALLERAAEAADLPLTKITAHGGRALERTEILQPVLVAVALAAFAALRERFRRPPREDLVHDENGAPVLARPIRTRTESRVRHGATIAAGRTPAEVWTLRIGAAIVVAIMLTAFVLLLAYLA